MTIIEPFDYSDEQYDALVTINNAIWPERLFSVADFKHEDAGRGPSAEKYAERWLARVADEIAGYAHAVHQWQRSGVHFSGNIEVLPTHRRRGVGNALLATLEERMVEKSADSLDGITIEDRTDTIAWLRKRGFKQIQCEPMSAIDVRTLTLPPIVLPPDITITSLAELSESDPDYKRKLFDLMWEIIADVPGSNADERERPDNDYFEQVTMGDPTYTPTGWFIAHDADGHYVGTANVYPKLTPGHWVNGLTGVVRARRRQGLASALKRTAMHFVQAADGVEIITSNDENNPMYDLNLALGYQPRPAILTFERKYS